MSTMTEREMLIAKANEEVEIQRMLADACEDEGDLEGAADCMKLVILLRNLVAALAQQQEAEPVAWVDEEGRVVRVSEDGSGDGGWVSGHDRAIPDSWTPLHPPKPAALPTMDDAIAAGNGTLHGAIDYWQERALKAEAAQPQVPEGCPQILR